MPIVTPLLGQRITVREWRGADLDAFHRWIGNPAVMRYLSWGTATRDDSAAQLAAILREQRRVDRKQVFLAIELNVSHRVIGDSGFNWIAPQTVEIGYFLEPAYWGQGYATEAATLIMGLAFRLGAECVIACCDARNTASENVMKRCGLVCQPAVQTGQLIYRRDRSIDLPPS